MSTISNWFDHSGSYIYPRKFSVSVYDFVMRMCWSGAVMFRGISRIHFVYFDELEEKLVFNMKCG